MEINEVLDQNVFLVTLSVGSIFIYLLSQRPQLVKKYKYN